MEKNIRKAKNSDIDEIEKLILYGAKHGKVLTRERSDIANDIQNFFVWENNKKIVGCCCLHIYSLKIAEIRSLVVLCDYQKNGIGSKLVQKCLKEAKRQGVYEVLAITQKDGFFNKLGFKKSVDNKWPMFVKL